MNILGFKIWKVTGHSMSPRIPQHSYVLVNHWFLFLKLKPGKTVLINHSIHGLIIKKVAIIDRNGFIWSKGENPLSMPIEKIGPVSRHQIIGRVLMIIQSKKQFN